jgi:hypothetical protein
MAKARCNCLLSAATSAFSVLYSAVNIAALCRMTTVLQLFVISCQAPPVLLQLFCVSNQEG